MKKEKHKISYGSFTTKTNIITITIIKPMVTKRMSNDDEDYIETLYFFKSIHKLNPIFFFIIFPKP